MVKFVELYWKRKWTQQSFESEISSASTYFVFYCGYLWRQKIYASEKAKKNIYFALDKFMCTTYNVIIFFFF